MSPENTEILNKSFPALFASPNKKGDSEFHFECADGWFDLIYSVAAICEPFALLAANNEEPFVATQVKEKFGGLRFYTSACPEEYFDFIYGLIHEAESKSYETCENCGGSTKDAGEVEEGLNDFFGPPGSKLVQYPKIGIRGFCKDCRKKWE